MKFILKTLIFKKVKTFNLRFFLRELIGLYRYIKAKKVYSFENHPVNISDNSPDSKQFNEESANSLNLLPKIGLTRKENALSNRAPIMPEPLKSWYIDPNLNVVLNHETRGHMIDDLLRYSYCAAYAQIQGLSPKSRHFPQELAPAHANWDTGTHSDRFRVQVASKYATTVTSHISKDGHYFVHYDLQQCRSLSVREAARLQTFPDNYIFSGSNGSKYKMLGNAVPPNFSEIIAKVIKKIIPVH